jgi:Flp pilus assembly protein TadG
MVNIARVFKSCLAPLLKSCRPVGRQGNIAVMAALMSVPVIGAAGLSVDGIRIYMLHDRMMNALDAAALAGGRVLSTANVEADVRMYFDVNIPADYLGATVGTPKVTVGANDETMTLSVSATLPATFARVLGVDTIPVTVTNRIRRTVRGMELALVLDVTGSMWSGNKIGQLRASATDLVNILFGPNEQSQTLWISLVPYTATVNLGSARQNWLTAT